MTDAIVALVEGALSTPWGLLALAAVAALDGFFPVVPSESLVVTAGVTAAAGYRREPVRPTRSSRPAGFSPSGEAP